MADEAFALSPISARATLPSEADYDAIREAFMETSRGRWFLTEYAKRNRNADTHMVLDAVARIEHSIAAQKQAPGSGLIESLGAIRTIVHDAKTAAAQALAAADGHATLVAARDGARIIRQIATTLRDCGADIRICDLLDNQLAVIDSGHREIAAISHRDAVLASFDLLMLQIGNLAAGDAATSQAGAPPQPAEPAAAAPPADQPREAEPSPATEATTDPAVVVAVGTIEIAGQVDTTDRQTPAPEAPAAAEMLADAAAPEPADIFDSERDEIEELDPEAALDFAVLDLVASEMAEPDLAESDLAEFALELSEPELAPPAPPAVPAVETMVAAKLAPAPEPQPAPPPVAKPAPEPAPSLGAALIAGGLVQRPAALGPDPLAPIRRLSQAERIAFFS